MKHILIFTALLYSATSFSQNQCADLFSLKNKSEKQSVESDILKHLDALVVEKLRIDNNRFENENQKRQAIETFKTSLFNIVKIDEKYLEIFKKKYSEKSIQYNIKSKSKDKKNRETENDRKKIIEESIKIKMKEMLSDLESTKANFNSDGKYIITISDKPYFESKVQIYDRLTGNIIFQKDNKSSTYSAEMSSDNKYIAVGSRDRTANIFEMSSGKEILVIQHTDDIRSTQFSPDNQFVLTGSFDGTSKLFDIATGKKIFEIQSANKNKNRLSSNITSAKFSPDGKFIIISDSDNSAKIFEIATGKQILNIKHKSIVYTAELVLMGNILLHHQQILRLRFMNSAQRKNCLKLITHKALNPLDSVRIVNILLLHQLTNQLKFMKLQLGLK